MSDANEEEQRSMLSASPSAAEEAPEDEGGVVSNDGVAPMEEEEEEVAVASKRRHRKTIVDDDDEEEEDGEKKDDDGDEEEEEEKDDDDDLPLDDVEVEEVVAPSGNNDNDNDNDNDSGNNEGGELNKEQRHVYRVLLRYLQSLPDEELQSMKRSVLKTYLKETLGVDVYKRNKQLLTHELLPEMVRDEVDRREAGQQDGLDVVSSDEEEQDDDEVDDVSSDYDEDYDSASSRRKKRRRTTTGGRSSGRRSKGKRRIGPKKPMTAYFAFTNAVRQDTRDKNPGKSMAEISKIIGLRWRQMSDVEKQEYHELAEEDKLRYQREYEQWAEEHPDLAAELESRKAAKRSRSTRSGAASKSSMISAYSRKRKARELTMLGDDADYVADADAAADGSTSSQLSLASSASALAIKDCAAFVRQMMAAAKGDVAWRVRKQKRLAEEQEQKKKQKKKRKQDDDGDNDDNDDDDGEEKKQTEEESQDGDDDDDAESDKWTQQKLTLLNSLLRAFRTGVQTAELKNQGILLAVKEWLRPLPDGTLPHLDVRESMYAALDDDFELTHAELEETRLTSLQDFHKQRASSTVGGGTRLLPSLKKDGGLVAVADELLAHDGEDAENKAQLRHLKKRWQMLPFDDVVQDLKTTRSRKEKRTPEQVREFCEQFVDQMMNCAVRDVEAYKKKAPAVYKIKFLPHVVSMVKQRQYQTPLITAGLLIAFKFWLTLLPDGSLPSKRVRCELYKLLSEDLRLDEQDLKLSRHKRPQRAGMPSDDKRDNGLGGVIVQLNRSQYETPENRRVLSRLLQTWSRLITGGNTDYKKLREHEALQRRRMVRRQRQLSQLSTVERVQRQNSRLPERAVFDYSIRPQFEEKDLSKDSSARKPKDNRHTSIRNTLRDKKKSKSSARAYTVSIVGK